MLNLTWVAQNRDWKYKKIHYADGPLQAKIPKNTQYRWSSESKIKTICNADDPLQAKTQTIHNADGPLQAKIQTIHNADGPL